MSKRPASEPPTWRWIVTAVIANSKFFEPTRSAISASASSIGRPRPVSVSTRLNSSDRGRLALVDDRLHALLERVARLERRRDRDQQVRQLRLERAEPAPHAAPHDDERDEPRRPPSRAGSPAPARRRRQRGVRARAQRRRRCRRTPPRAAACRRGRASSAPPATAAGRPNACSVARRRPASSAERWSRRRRRARRCAAGVRRRGGCAPTSLGAAARSTKTATKTSSPDERADGEPAALLYAPVGQELRRCRCAGHVARLHRDDERRRPPSRRRATEASRRSRSPGRAEVTYESARCVRAAARSSRRRRASASRRGGAEVAAARVACELSRARPGRSLDPRCRSGRSTTFASRAAAIACASVAWLETSRPSVSTISTRPASGLVRELLRRQHDRVVERGALRAGRRRGLAGQRPRRSSRSRSCSGRSARGPNATTAIASAARLLPRRSRAPPRRRPRAACPASSGESSTASTTAFARPRFSAVSPTTGPPFSVSVGAAERPADETTVARIVGKALVSTAESSTRADAGAAAASAATATATYRTRRLTRTLRTSAAAARRACRGRPRPRSRRSSSAERRRSRRACRGTAASAPCTAAASEQPYASGERGRLLVGRLRLEDVLQRDHVRLHPQHLGDVRDAAACRRRGA